MFLFRFHVIDIDDKLMIQLIKVYLIVTYIPFHYQAYIYQQWSKKNDVIVTSIQ